MMPKILALTFIALAASSVLAQPSQSGRKPNFVVIFTDDQGYQDLGCYGSPDIKTPRTDQMAAEGMRFTDFYVAAPVCTPSRAALLTGSYPARNGMAGGVLHPNSTNGLNPDEITIAEILKAQGYATACIGKWHLGDAPVFLPTRQGFDVYFGIPFSNDMGYKPADVKETPLMRGEKVIEQPVDQRTLTERYTTESIKFITENKDRPFFLYLPHTMPHVPLFVSKKFAGKSARGLYGDVIEEIDWSTGRILDALKGLGLDDDTLLVFTSDNGPWLVKGADGGSALPLRDGKATTYEGGVRVPCVMRWPGHIPEGVVSHELATAMDLLPTMVALAGAEAPQDRVIDGRDIRALVAGEAEAKSPHEAFFYHTRQGALDGVRSGPWKLLLHEPAELYHLEKDISESTNVAAENPEVAARLRRLAADFADDLAQHNRPQGEIVEAEKPARKAGKRAASAP